MGGLVKHGQDFLAIDLITCLPLLAALCLEKEKKVLQSYRVGSNLCGEEASNFGKLFSALKSKHLVD
eukprot:2928281-Ditylum_brightwellii.AAC.1